MKKLSICFILICVTLSSQAQSTFSGHLYDSLDYKNVPFASVSLLNAKDSVLHSFTRSDAKGMFALKNLPKGDYILLIAQSKYFTYSKDLKIDTNIHLDNIILYQKSKMLKAVLVKANNPITIKGDTIKYFADSFKTKQGAVVEDLLKKLPGIQVDENGNIKSQGAEVKKVLVNGEEFFGADPTIATKNLPSKAVEKVEVYDYKDEQESFTGFTNDEEKTKVVNLKLKKEMNKGGFGKASLYGGWEDRWEQKIMLNRFQDKEQIGAYYMANSNELARLNWEEGKDFGSSTSFMNDDGDFVTTMSWDGDGTSNPFWGGADYGITKSWKAGARYANKFDKNNQALTVNYSFLRATRDRNHQRYTENLIPGAQFNKIDSSQQFTESNGHTLNASYKTDIDSLTSISFNTKVSTRTNQSNTKTDYYNNTNNELPISFNNRTSIGENTSNSVNNTINIKKKFIKKGRTISLRLNQRYSQNQGLQMNKSTNAFDLQNGGSIFILDQENRRDNISNSINTNIVYTEPISDKLKLKLSYNFNYSNNDNQNIVNDTLGFTEGNYLRQIDSLSNIFSSVRNTHRPGFELRYEIKKWRFSLRNSISINNFIQNDLLRDNNFDFSQTNYIPGFSVRYKLSKYKTIKLNYSGNTSNPSPNQIQPFPNINNPLNIIVGNPNLRMAYNQRVRMSYSGYAPLGGSNMYVTITGRNSINRIGTSRTFDETGRTTTTYVNLPNAFGGNMYSYIGKKITNTNFRIGTSMSGDYGYNPNIINEISGFSENISFMISPRISYQKSDLMSIYFTPEISWRSNMNSGNISRKITYFEYSPRIGTDIWLPNFFTISSTIRYDYTPAVAPYNTPFTRLFGTGSIKKRLLKDKSLELKFSVFDIFNQNQGYHRQSRINYNTESFYNTLGRYWMFGASWSIFKGPGMDERKASTEKTGKAWSKLFGVSIEEEKKSKE